MPRKSDSSNPSDWLWLAGEDLAMVRLAGAQEIAFSPCRSKLAEALEKILKAELIRMGWQLERTHDLKRLSNELASRHSPIAASAVPVCEALSAVYFADRYPGFDVDDPDWPALRARIEQVAALLAVVRAHLVAP